MENETSFVNTSNEVVDIEPANAGTLMSVDYNGENEITAGQAAVGMAVTMAVGYGLGKAVEFVYNKWGIPLFKKLGKKAEDDEVKLADKKNRKNKKKNDETKDGDVIEGTFVRTNETSDELAKANEELAELKKELEELKAQKK